MDMEWLRFKIKVHIMVIGKKAKCMVKEHLLGWMVHHIREIIFLEKNMDLVDFFSVLVIIIRVIGHKENKMEKDYFMIKIQIN